MKRLIALLLAVSICPAQMINTGNHRKAGSGYPPAAACGSSITNVGGDYWANSLSATPVTTNWADSSSYGNAMAPTASPTWANNTFGTGLAGVTLNGTSQYFGAVTKVFPQNGSGTTWSAYAIISMTSGGGGGLSGSQGSNGPIRLYVHQAGDVGMESQGQVALCSATGLTFTAGTTYEVAGIWTDGGTCAIYVNGSSVVSTSHSSIGSRGGDDRMLVSGTPLYDYFKGSVYEIMFSTSGSYQSGAHTCWTALGLP